MSTFTTKDSLIEAIQFRGDVEPILKWAREHTPEFTFEKVKDFLIIPSRQPHVVEQIKSEMGIEDELDPVFDHEVIADIEEFAMEAPCDMVCNVEDYLILGEGGSVSVLRKDFFEQSFVRVRCNP